MATVYLKHFLHGIIVVVVVVVFVVVVVVVVAVVVAVLVVVLSILALMLMHRNWANNAPYASRFHNIKNSRSRLIIDGVTKKE